MGNLIVICHGSGITQRSCNAYMLCVTGCCALWIVAMPARYEFITFANLRAYLQIGLLALWHVSRRVVAILREVGLRLRRRVFL